MKKILTVIAMCFVLMAADKTFAQDSGWWVGGRVGYWHDKTNGTTANSFSIAPEFGYDFNKKWSLGGIVGFDYVKEANVSANVFVIEPYARYKCLSRDAFTLFVDGGFGIAMGDADGFKVGLAPGIAFKLSEHFSMLASVGFFGYKNDYYNGGGDGFGFDLKSSDLRFGFFYSF